MESRRRNGKVTYERESAERRDKTTQAGKEGGAVSRRADSAAADRVAASLKRRIGARKYGLWFEHRPLRVDDRTLEVTADSQFAADWVHAHFAADLDAAVVEAMGRPLPVQVTVAPQDSAAAAPFQQERGPSARDGASLLPHGRSDDGDAGGPAVPARRDGVRRRVRLHRLEDFVVGPSNRLAHAAACRLVDEPDAGVSPLFIHGECGVGKTHLLQGVCQRYIERTGQAHQVRYVTGEQFTNEYIASVRNDEIEMFRARIRRLELLAIDDVHFLSAKSRTQEEFLHTLQAIDLRGARVVLASDNHPHHIRSFSQPLISRFVSGMVVQVERLDFATRMELIRRMARRRAMLISDAAVEAVASHCVASARELEGALTKLAAYRDLQQPDCPDGEIGMVLVDQAFKEDRGRPTQQVRLGAVIDAVCSHLSVSRADLLGQGRHRRVVLARSMVAYLSREMTTQSFPEIAQAMGRENHSTVHTADARLRRQIAANEPVDAGAATATSVRELAEVIRREILRAAR